MERFIEEVETVRKALDLSDLFSLGHSWGGLLALEYAYHYPAHLKGLIISNTPFTEYGTNQYRNLLWENTEKQLAGKWDKTPDRAAVHHAYERTYRHGLDTVPAVFE